VFDGLGAVVVAAEFAAVEACTNNGLQNEQKTKEKKNVLIQP